MPYNSGTRGAQLYVSPGVWCACVFLPHDQLSLTNNLLNHHSENIMPCCQSCGLYHLPNPNVVKYQHHESIAEHWPGAVRAAKLGHNGKHLGSVDCLCSDADRGISTVNNIRTTWGLPQIPPRWMLGTATKGNTQAVCY